LKRAVVGHVAGMPKCLPRCQPCAVLSFARPCRRRPDRL